MRLLHSGRHIIAAGYVHVVVFEQHAHLAGHVTWRQFGIIQAADSATWWSQLLMFAVMAATVVSICIGMGYMQAVTLA